MEVSMLVQMLPWTLLVPPSCLYKTCQELCSQQGNGPSLQEAFRQGPAVCLQGCGICTMSVIHGTFKRVCLSVTSRFYLFFLLLLLLFFFVQFCFKMQKGTAILHRLLSVESNFWFLWITVQQYCFCLDSFVLPHGCFRSEIWGKR